jgi:hypothetical protein
MLKQLVVSLATIVAIAGAYRSAAAQAAGAAPRPAHLTIPFLANASKPLDLDFEGGECDVDAAGERMTCQFQQVLLTVSDLAPQTCFVTTNHYDRVFEKQTATRWVSRQQPDGPCGTVDVATLQDDGGIKWTMEMRKIVTSKDASPACLLVDEKPETLSWQNVRRPLPCTFIQPGSLSR